MVISVSVVVVVVAPALAALTEVEGDVVAAPLEVVDAKGFAATSANVIKPNADVVASPLRPIQFASVHALGLMGIEKKNEKEDKTAPSFCQH